MTWILSINMVPSFLNNPVLMLKITCNS